ncbi:MAG: acyl-CoA carboxylase subunit epsilon [Micropruina sp.]|nr:acyl-CoA carboxylase subunit epsilon [Micropruina sp.]
MTGAIVVRGQPTDAELAALTAVLLGRRDAPDEPAAEPPRTWGSPRNRLRLAPAPGPGAWRAALRH